MSTSTVERHISISKMNKKDKALSIELLAIPETKNAANNSQK